jgi:2-hydroxychromene-2-carboxylate isomerase
VSEPIRFLFDYISPYAYIAWTQLGALAARNHRSIEPVPVLFAALLNHGGQKGPAEIPAKRIWVWKDTLRTARLLGLPLAPPPNHPYNPLLSLRATAGIDDLGERARFIDAMYRRAWGGGGGVETPELIAAAASEAGLDGDAVLAKASTQPVKDALRANTDRAIADGAFGVPTMMVGPELFWGYDAFDHLERHLQGKDPFTPEDLSRWMNLKPSATR